MKKKKMQLGGRIQ